MIRGIAAGALALLAAAACGSSSGSVAPHSGIPGAARDVRELARTMESTHPNLFHTVSRDAFRRAAEELALRAASASRDELLVGVMRLAALPGPRDGHGGMFPLAEHRSPLHLYPLRLYRFSDGLFVIGELGAPGTVGARLLAIEGVPLAELEAKVAPLVSRDNDFSLAARLPEWLVTAEVLHGLGITPTAGSARFTLETRAGERLVLTLRPVGAAAYAGAFGYAGQLLPPPGRQPRYLRLADRERWIATLGGGRTVLAAYNFTGSAYEFARDLSRRARGARVRRVVIDLRLNPGGDNTSYGALLGALVQPAVNRRGRLFVLIGRHTYSAAGNLAAEIDRRTRATLVGEPTGGSPDNYGGSSPIRLPALGWNVYVANGFQEGFGRPGEKRLATRPDVRVGLSSADFFAGRDPVLEAALR